jgi:glycosyltransferase involved in cell wall biosynthesis
MRIIQVIAARGYGGAEKHVLTLSEGLLAAGHEVLCIVPKNSWMRDECARLGIPHQAITFRGAYDFMATWSLRRVIRNWNADVAHGHLTRASRYVNIATRGTSAVPVNTCHATTSHKHMRGSRKIIAVSRAVKQNLIHHGYPEESLEVVWNGVAEAAKGDRAAMRRELGIADDTFAIVCVGRMIPDKGQKLLVEILPELPKHMHIYFIGDDATPYGRELRELAGGNPRVHFVGFCSNVPRILGAFDLYVGPSLREALSIALIEASQAGLPIVASQVGGNSEVVADQESGLLVSLRDKSEWARKITCLAENPILLERYGKQARRFYEEKFTSEAMTQATARLYEKALAVCEERRCDGVG